jgi:hypothetical protein
MKGFPVPSQKSSSCWRITTNSGEPEIVEDFRLLQLEILLELILKILIPVRNILDILEPQHARQIWPRPFSLFTCLSYSFSVFRWRRAILNLNPSLEETLNILEHLYHWLLQNLLVWLDGTHLVRDRFLVAISLTIFYEGISCMEPSDMINPSVNEHLQSAITDRIAHIYCLIIAQYSTAGKSRYKELKFYAVMFSLFTRTSSLLPPECRYDVSESERIILNTHKHSSGSEWESTSYMDYTNYEYSPLPSKPDLSILFLHVPARFFAIFGFSTETFLLVRENINNSHHLAIKYTEIYFHDTIMSCAAPTQDSLLFLSPITLSIGLQVVADHIIANTSFLRSQEKVKTCLVLAILISALASRAFLMDIHQQKSEGKFKSLRSWSALMQKWVEDSVWIRAVKLACPKLRDAIMGLGEPGPTTAAPTSTESAPRPRSPNDTRTEALGLLPRYPREVPDILISLHNTHYAEESTHAGSRKIHEILGSLRDLTPIHTAALRKEPTGKPTH